MKELLLILPEDAARGELDVDMLRGALEDRGAWLENLELEGHEDRILDRVETGYLPIVVKGGGQE